MKRKQWIRLGAALACAGFFAFGGADLVAQALQQGAQDAQRSRYAKQPNEKGINVHEFGIRVAVQNPMAHASFERRIIVRDLGPNVSHLTDDRVPGAAYLKLDGGAPEAFRLQPDGTLVFTLPPSRLSPLGTHTVEVTVHGLQGESLFSVSLEGLFF